MTGQRGPSSDAVPSPRTSLEPPQFDMVLRGYDRIEVDEYIAALLEENTALRRELDARASRPEPAVPQQAAAPPTSPQYYDVDTPAEDSFGFRAEKLLRLAERESAEMRTRATRDAEAVEAAARRRSEEQLRAAEKEAEEIRAAASTDALKVKKQAAQEVSRLTSLHRSTKGEIRRLSQLLNAELERPDPEGLTDDAPAGSQSGNPASN